MFKLKVKRRMSGRKIRDTMREERLRPLVTVKMVASDGTLYEHQYRKTHYSDHKYWRNNPQKRGKENPNLYEGEQWTGYGTLRQPKKCRKTAWKRYNKIKAQVDARGQPKAEPLPW